MTSTRTGPALEAGILEFLSQIEKRVGAPVSNPTVHDRRVRIEEMGRSFALKDPPEIVIRDWFVAVAGREIPIRIYRPQGAASGPCLIFLHGGGWIAGSLESHHSLVALLARDLGWTVVAVHYRRPPENPFPAPLDDCVEVWRWAQAHADFLGIEPDKMALAGDSAGGHLAVGCALRVLDSPSPPIALALLYPCIEPRFDRRSYEEFAAGPFLTRSDMVYFWTALLGDLHTDDPYASPTLSPDLASLPPTYVTVAEIDPVRDDGELFAARLAAAGVSVTTRRAQGLPHGFFRALEFSAGARGEFTALVQFLLARFAGRAASAL